MIAFTRANETGVKSLLSTPTSYCVEKAFEGEAYLFQCYSCLYAHGRKAARYHRMSRYSKGTGNDSDKSSVYPPRCTSAS